MPYKIEGSCVMKEDGSEVPGGCHKTHEEAVAHLRALEANVKNSGVVEMSMRITKASYNKSDTTPRHWAAIDSDIEADLYQEKMSLELYQDFQYRIDNNVPVPEPFRDVICEDTWCGGMPYLSIAHYKSGTGGNNVPGVVTSVFIDGTRLKSKGILYDNPLGRKTFDALCDDYNKMKSNVDHLPVRISIGFLDLEHKHLSEVGGQEFTFTRTDIGQLCPMCVQGIGGKVYTKGQLVHLAMTRVPVNPRTEMNVERSMEITTKRDDAASIVGELADELEEKSIAGDVLVVRSEDGSMPKVDSSELTSCYDPNTGGWNQSCIDAIMNKYMVAWRDSIGTVAVKSETMPKALLDAVQKSVTELYKSNGYEPVVEDAMTETVEKMVAGGVSVPEKKFEYEGIDGSGNNTVSNPVKAKVAEADEPEAEEKKEAVKEMSNLDKTFEQLKSTLANAKTVEEVQNAFNALGQEVEKSYTPPAPDMSNIAEIVRSAVEAAVTPLKVEIATLKASQAQSPATDRVVKSKALSLGNFTNPEQMIQRAVKPVEKKLSQIEELARRSTGLQS